MNFSKLIGCLLCSVVAATMLAGCQNSTITDDQSWKTVEHELYGFTMEYPPGWNAYTYGDWGYRGKDNRNLKLQITKHGDNADLRLRYQEATNPTLDDVEIWVNRVLLDSLDAAYEKLGLPAVERKEMHTGILNGKEVLRQTIIEPEGVTTECVYLARSKDMISICLQGSPILEEHREAFEQMLKTFRPME